MTSLCTCGGDSDVLDSRPDHKGVIRRRRKCKACNARWSTVEVLTGTLAPVHQPSILRIEQAIDSLKEAAEQLKGTGQ